MVRTQSRMQVDWWIQKTPMPQVVAAVLEVVEGMETKCHIFLPAMEETVHFPASQEQVLTMVVEEEEEHSMNFLQAAAAGVEVAPEILIQGSQSLVQVHQTRGAAAAVL
jgi:hypothetical protein